MFLPGGESWRPPLFKIGKVPFNLPATIILVEVVAAILLVLAAGVGNKSFYEAVQFRPEMFAKGEIWRLITYPFFEVPGLFWAIGLFFFYSFGTALEQQIGRGSFLRLLLALIGIAPVVSLILYTATRSPAMVVFGNSIAHFGIFIAFCATMPNAPSFFGIKIKWFGLAFLVLAILQFLGAGLPAMALALAIGSAYAVFYIQRAGFKEKFAIREEIFGPKMSKASKKRPKRKQERKLRPRTSVDVSSATEIDRILDKINDEGFQSLTEKERETLQKSAKK